MLRNGFKVNRRRRGLIGDNDPLCQSSFVPGGIIGFKSDSMSTVR
jgi:hypothetical protein